MASAEVLFDRDAFFAGEKVHCDILIRFLAVPQQQQQTLTAMGEKSGVLAGTGVGASAAGAASASASSFSFFSFFTQRQAETEKAESVELLEFAVVQLHGHEAHDPRLVRSACEELNEEEEEEGEQEGIMGQVKSDGVRGVDQLLIHRASDEHMVVRRTNSGSAMMTTTGNGIATPSYFVGLPDMKSFSGTFGACLFSSPVHVLAKMLRVVPGTERRYQFSVRLPPVLPPSYRGTSVRYWYLITVGLKLKSAQQPIHFSFPVQVLGLGEDYNQSLGISSSIEQPQPLDHLSSRDRKAAIATPAKKENVIEISESFSSRIPHAIEGEGVTRALRYPRKYPNHRYDPSSREIGIEATSRINLLNGSGFSAVAIEKDTLAANLRRSRGPGRALTIVDPNLGGLRLRPRINSDAPSLPRPPVSVNIGSGDGHIARFTLRKSFVSPGEDFLIAFDFSHASVRCFKVNVSVEQEEKCVANPPPQAAFAALTVKTPSSSRQQDSQFDPVAADPSSYFGESSVGPGPWTRALVVRECIVSSSVLFSMILTIPCDSTPDFATDFVFVHSFLRFEFFVARSGKENFGATINAEDATVLRWRLPLHVRPWSLLLRERASSGIGW